MLTEVVAGISVFIVVLATQPAFAGETITGRVVGVSDGDTITVLDSTKTQHKIRLAGIDAPESKQAFGQASKKSLAAMVFDRDVTLDCGKTDRYRRRVCVVIVDGKDANVAQVAAGMAWWYRKYQNEQTVRQREAYAAAEEGEGAVPPWEWRHKNTNY